MVIQVKMARSDLLQQALENSGLAQPEGTLPDGAKSPQHTPEIQVVATEGTEMPPPEPDTTVSEASTTVATTSASVAVSSAAITNMAQNAAQQVPDKSNCAVISTLTIHDAATGTIKKHIIRKVRVGYK